MDADWRRGVHNLHRAHCCHSIVEVDNVGEEYRWELPGKWPVFYIVIVIYHYVDIIGEFLFPPIFNNIYDNEKILSR